MTQKASRMEPEQREAGLDKVRDGMGTTEMRKLSLLDS